MDQAHIDRLMQEFGESAELIAVLERELGHT
jgi:hypothetical protein